MTEHCPICKRELGQRINDHHLIPKTFKGSDTIRLHMICHNAIHSYISERELVNYYHTIERLLKHEQIRKFVKWVQKKPIDFYVKTKDSKIRKKKR